MQAPQPAQDESDRPDAHREPGDRVEVGQQHLPEPAPHAARGAPGRAFQMPDHLPGLGQDGGSGRLDGTGLVRVSGRIEPSAAKEIGTAAPPSRE